MVLNALELDGFRNYRDFRAEFSPGANVICGRNAQGKTNLLEAVCLLAQGRGHRGARDRDMIGFDRDFAGIRADITSGGRDIALEARLTRAGRREVFRNGAKLRRTADLTGSLTAVMFDPTDLELVRGGAETRRRELDACISQLRPRYAAALAEFNRFYAHKLKILKNFREKPSLLDALDDFNRGLTETGARLIFYRAAFVTKLGESARRVHAECSGGLETLAVAYKTERGVDTENPELLQIASALEARQREHREHEIASGMCLTGAQRDDMEVAINGVAARAFASQGQARTASLSVKLAERDIIAGDTGEAPVLLLDDVLSELDVTRREFVLGRIGGGQVLITCCEPGEITLPDGGRVMEIHGGRLVSCT
ncbi:MAG: DNA replication/repair protein RecF [Oscillospiraceae bacterium]|jgi:DNA replication and repair protein RecF|nr:DNA replication/repair protein RecF [Oscillospiraceae bacterium]